MEWDEQGAHTKSKARILHIVFTNTEYQSQKPSLNHFEASHNESKAPFQSVMSSQGRGRIPRK